ncbi:Protein N-terminal amidase [Daldinia childiae]|uniref:Protein N-terminal amidase n=1 Tax=Daldinia childiae TaxID=326645 RepID=UPI001447DC82|nr:Protein N-terminal amidase [Daldinia childiae]KAF3064548.1 Protein N-terminal amidase [Daldinia childiae]
MDINPYKFEAPFHAFEFAFHVLEMGSNLVILTMAWLTREDGRMFSRMPNDPDLDTLTYWVTRLEPLIRAESEEEIIVVFANRCGIEDDAVYAGTSAVIGIKDGEVSVYGILGRGEKELLVVDTDAAPYAKLVYRPDDNASTVTSTDDESRGGSSNRSTRPDKEDPSKRSEQPRSTRGNDSTNIPTTQTPKSTDSARMSKTPAQPISPLSESTLANYESMSPSGATKDYDYVPLGHGPRAGSDRRSRKFQVALELLRETLDSKGLASHRLSSKKVKTASPRIQIPPPKLANDSIPTPTAPSPTPLAVRPKLSIPKDAHRRPHIPTPHPDSGQSHIPMEQQNTILTPTTAFDDLSPQFPARSFWTPSDSRLWTSMELQDEPPVLEYPTRSSKPIIENKSRVAEVDIQSRKPSPPKSRITSRSRKHERSNSTFGQGPDSSALAQRPETISPRPESSIGQRVDTSSPYQIVPLPSSPKSPKCKPKSAY